MLTPGLPWYDGTPSRLSVYVRPFNTNDNSITVDWGQADTWVDYKYFGAEKGTFAQPYMTLNSGAWAVVPWGTVYIKSGASPEKVRLTKAMRIEAYGGPVTIGR
jgi:hypothetical protein